MSVEIADLLRDIRSTAMQRKNWLVRHRNASRHLLDAHCGIVSFDDGLMAAVEDLEGQVDALSEKLEDVETAEDLRIENRDARIANIDNALTAVVDILAAVREWECPECRGTGAMSDHRFVDTVAGIHKYKLVDCSCTNPLCVARRVWLAEEKR